MARLQGKTAFITGGASGIGRAAAILFAQEGARVVIADILLSAAEDVAHEAAKAGADCGGAAIALRTDVTEPDSWQESLAQAVNHFGPLHVLYNNAGGSTQIDDTAVDVPLEEFWRAIKLDLFGTFLGCRFGIPELIKAGGGSVINMSSNVALMGFPGRDAYTAAKGGVAAITRSLAVSYAAQKVRVNAIAPSVTQTPRVIALMAANAAVARIGAQHLLGLGEPMDVAYAALYLASDESRITTGTIMRVDSGITIS